MRGGAVDALLREDVSLQKAAHLFIDLETGRGAGEELVEPSVAVRGTGVAQVALERPVGGQVPVEGEGGRGLPDVAGQRAAAHGDGGLDEQAQRRDAGGAVLRVRVVEPDLDL